MADEKVVNPDQPLYEQELTPWRWDRSLCEECNIALYRDLHYKKTPWESESF